MVYSNLTSLAVAGVPTIGTGGLLPFTGNYYFVNESTGSDGNTGQADNPFATIDRALTKCTANNNDVVFVTGTIHTTATINWNKNFTHLIGLTAPSMNCRARISSSGSTVFTPLVNVTAQGCIFANIGTFYGYADASTQICWVEAGQRNFYQSVQFFGMGNATAAAQAGSRSLTIGAAGQGENKFVDCVIGLDTVTRTAANASLEFLGGSPRNKFINCEFPAYVGAGGNGATFIKAASSSIDRENIFLDTRFINQVRSASGTMDQAFSISGSAGGLLWMHNCAIFGTTAAETTPSTNIIGMGPTVTANVVNKALAQNW